MLTLLEGEEHHGLSVYEDEDGVKFAIGTDEEADLAARKVFLENIESVSVDALINWMACEAIGRSTLHSEWKDFKNLLTNTLKNSPPGARVLILLLLGENADNCADQLIANDGRETYLCASQNECPLSDLLSPSEIERLGLTPAHCVFEL